jgi:hypothetical protein
METPMVTDLKKPRDFDSDPIDSSLYQQLIGSLIYLVNTRSNIFFVVLAQGQTQGSMLQQRTNKSLTTDPFGNTCEADEVSPKVEAGVVARLKCLQP